jgi:hypothetical protein
MAANSISTLASKENKQTTKLLMAEAKRQGKVVALDGTWTGSANSSQPWSRTLNVLDLDLLPTVFSGNSIVDNPNGDGGALTQGRPWGDVAVGVLPDPVDNPEEAVAPTTFITLQFWYDGADTDQFVPSATDEGQITQWTDKSVLAHNANPAGGSAKPSYENTVPLNGYGYLEFDGNDHLTINPFTDLQSQPGFTLFIVSKFANTTGVKHLSDTDSGDLAMFADGTTMTVGMEGVTATVASEANTNWAIHTLAFDGSQTGNAARLVYRKDKTAKTLSFTGTVGETTNASQTVYDLGNEHGGGSNGMEGYIAEAILFKKALTSAEIQNIENYISNKWGL